MLDNDIYMQYTYVKSGGNYLLGAVTEKAYIKYIDEYMYFFTSNGGSSDTSRQYYYRTYKTPNYDNPDEKALYWYGNPWTEYLNMTIYGQKFNL